MSNPPVAELSAEKIARFWSHVNKTPTCWLWTHYILPEGYGRMTYSRGEAYLAHRFAFEALRGPIPEGLHLDHLCRVRNCVNPAHLEPVTPKVNFLRGYGVGAVNARKTHCVRGHEFTPENTHIGVKNGKPCRVCRECRRMHSFNNNRKRRAREGMASK